MNRGISFCDNADLSGPGIIIESCSSGIKQ